MAGPEIPKDILDRLEEAFKDDPDTQARIIFFLSDALAQNIAHPFIRSLQAVCRTPAVFKNVAERMAQDTKTADTDPKYR